ncbi:hypothetical protein [Clostridium sp. L2-50]|uniref:hypothetical protein n=1 Tax=Clostridium sp. L2-50 TaxID=411489 RepID=UPI00015BE846|nr:hypothetical protein [Clostridium sp. L2-50]EDO57351.1 hypothetical protein CLOL250_02161 [Clostridium sp. L2-50]UEA74461.1 hypothetical protein LK416_12490 [Lachnospiraceae bacterium GAM79]UEA77658.1 hypothetical protein LK424_02570 [Lachnospiraceae bacterium GAM79]
MISSIDILDKYGLSLKGFKDRLIVGKSEISEIENYIYIRKNVKMLYDVCERHRNKDIVKVQDLSMEAAIIISIVLYKRMYDNILDYNATRELRKLLDENNIDKVITYFKQFSSDIYVIGGVEVNKLSLINNTYGYDILFNGKTIVENASLSRAYIVLYNYCKAISEIRKFYFENKDYYIKNKIDITDMIELYIL